MYLVSSILPTLVVRSLDQPLTLTLTFALENGSDKDVVGNVMSQFVLKDGTEGITEDQFHRLFAKFLGMGSVMVLWGIARHIVLKLVLLPLMAERVARIGPFKRVPAAVLSSLLITTWGLLESGLMLRALLKAQQTARQQAEEALRLSREVVSELSQDLSRTLDDPGRASVG